MCPTTVCCYRYSRFPDDRGIWSCSRFDGARQRVSLMVLVPPRARELVLPSNISLIDITSEAWAFTCSAQYAFPPVTLSWLKVSGRFISTLTTLKYIYLNHGDYSLFHQILGVAFFNLLGRCLKFLRNYVFIFPQLP